MLRSAEFFKDETLQGISKSIKHLHQMQAEAIAQKMENFGVTKNNPHFRSLLNFLDMGLSLGLQEPHKGYWPMIKKISHKATVQMVESHEEASNCVTRGQIWLFLTFIESSLLGYLRMLTESKKTVKWFYKKYALLRDEERFEILEQLIVGLEMVNFVLDFNSPYLASGREPMFKPREFYDSGATKGSPKTRTDNAELNVGPDVTLATQGFQTQQAWNATPDLLRSKTQGVQTNGMVAQHSEQMQTEQTGTHREPRQGLLARSGSINGDDLVTHLRTKKKDASVKRKKVVRRSESNENELEDDNYIPEFLDSFPITVVVPDDPKQLETSIRHIASESSFSDDGTYTNFLMEFKGDADTTEEKATSHAEICTSLDEEISSGLCLDHHSDEDEAVDKDPRVVSPENDSCDKSDVFGAEKHDEHDEHDGDDGGNGIMSSSVHSDGAYRITYVSEDEDESEVAHSLSREKYRTASLDSFDRFCRSGSVGQDNKKKSYNEDEDREDNDDNDNDNDDDVDLSKLRISPIMEPNEDPNARSPARDVSFDSEAISSSVMSDKLSKESVDKVLTARFDTTTGILLPTLPRRPDLAEACNMYHSASLEQNTLVLLSLEVFEKSSETFKKIFDDVYIGYIFGFRKRVSLLVTSEFMYVLSRQEMQEPGSGYLKEISLPLDSINRIQTGLNAQDVLISHDTGQMHMWTGNEVLTKHIILTLSTELRAGDARAVSVEQMKVETHSSLEFIINDWLLLQENKEDSIIYHLTLVDFYAITANATDKKVLKSGYLHHKQSYLGMVPYWDTSIFGLRGALLYEYSGKGTNELKHVYDLSDCGGCVRIKTADKSHAVRILNKDGSSPLLELAAETEDEANDWIVNICQVVADSKQGHESQMIPYSDGVSPRGLLLSSEKLYIFVQDSNTGRLVRIDSCTVHDITQICVDNQDRTYCVVMIDDSIDNQLNTEKRKWILKFHSEFELGKFEQKLFAAWHLLYQVPLQFVLLAEKDLKSSIQRYIAIGRSESVLPVGDNSISIQQLASL